MTNFEVGTVLHLITDLEFYYFIYDITEETIYYSEYIFADNSSYFTRKECKRKNINKNKIKNAKRVPNGELVKRLMTVDSVV
jgi:hypothetical protein